jgi:hypothetical protein
MFDPAKIVKSVFSWRPALGIGVALILLGLAYLLNLQSDLDKYIPIDNIINRLGIDHRVLTYWTLFLGLAAISVDMFLYSTDLGKSQLSGEYFSKISYGTKEINRIIREQRLVEVAAGEDLEIDPRREQLMREIDKRVVETITASRFDKNRYGEFYQRLSDLETELRLHISFKPSASRKSVFNFDGFGVIIDKHRGTESKCGIVVASSAHGRHNHLEISGIGDRAKLLWDGKVVSIELQQLIDPFQRFEEFRILLKFRIRRHLLSGWSISEGVYFIWDKETKTFHPNGYTYDIAISK